MSVQRADGQTIGEIWQWSARATRHAIARREISVEEAVSSSLARIAEVNSTVNAFVEVSEDEALERARDLDRRDAEAPCGVLHGIPVAVKDNVDQAGHVNSQGVVAGAQNVATGDAPVVTAMRDADAVFVGRTNVPAFSFRWFSENDLYGRTLNPWSAAHTPGGSSGGAASAVALGMVPLAHGNDIGGSIRYPAWACGVAGIRPTSGRIPIWHPKETWPGLTPATAAFTVEGALARHVDDLRLALEAMSRPDLRDISHTPVPFRSEEPLSRGARVGLVRAIPGVETDTSALDALDRASGALADAGYLVEEVQAEEFAEAHRLWWLLVLEEMRADLPAIDLYGDEAVKASVKHCYAFASDVWGPAPTLQDYLEGHMLRSRLIHSLESRLREMPLLLTPVSAYRQLEHGSDVGEYADVVPLINAQWPMLAGAALGFPAASVPTGLDRGLPTGVQIVGGRFRESWVLDAAEAVETRLGRITPVAVPQQR